VPAQRRPRGLEYHGTFPASQTITGGFPGDPETLADVQAATEDEPTVEFVDCWERRLYRKNTLTRAPAELFEDWQVSTMIADAQVMFVQRRNPDLPRTRTGKRSCCPGTPFVGVVPKPLPITSGAVRNFSVCVICKAGSRNICKTCGTTCAASSIPRNFFRASRILKKPRVR